MKISTVFSTIAVLALAAVTGCASTAPNLQPVQVTASGLGVTASGLPVMSGNYAAIPSGAAGDGGGGHGGSASGK